MSQTSHLPLQPLVAAHLVQVVEPMLVALGQEQGHQLEQDRFVEVEVVVVTLQVVGGYLGAVGYQKVAAHQGVEVHLAPLQPFQVVGALLQVPELIYPMRPNILHKKGLIMCLLHMGQHYILN